MKTMVFKLIVCCIVLLLSLGINNSLAVEYVNTIDHSYVLQTGTQDEIRERLTSEDIQAIRGNFTKNGTPLSEAKVIELLSDNNTGEVTKYADQLVQAKNTGAGGAGAGAGGAGTGGAGAGAGAGAGGAGAGGAGAGGGEREVSAELSPGDCSYDGIGDISKALEKCVTEGGTRLFDSKESKLDVAGDGFKNILKGWISKIAGFLALGAIFAIAYGSLRMTLSGGEEERIKKAKDIVKWGVLGFLAVISAGFLITLVVNIMYSF